MSKRADRIIKDLCKRASGDTIVFAPVTYTDKWGFHVGFSDETGFKLFGFRFDEQSRSDAERFRALIITGLIGSPLKMIHDMDDEVQMLRLCEALWPCKRITDLRKEVEAERATWDRE
jgi:hypothetical protein